MTRPDTVAPLAGCISLMGDLVTVLVGVGAVVGFGVAVSMGVGVGITIPTVEVGCGVGDGVDVGGAGVVRAGLTGAALRVGLAVGVSVGGTGVSVGGTGVGVEGIGVAVGGLVGIMVRGVGLGTGGQMIPFSAIKATVATTANMPEPTIHFKTPAGPAMSVG